MTTSKVLKNFEIQMARLLRTFPLVEIKFAPQLEFLGERGSRKKLIEFGELPPSVERTQSWLMVLWNRSAIRSHDQIGRHRTLYVNQNSMDLREFHVKMVACELTYAFISPDLDLLEGVEEWLVVGGIDDFQNDNCDALKTVLYPCKEKITISPNIESISPSEYALPMTGRDGTISTLIFTFKLSYPALIRSDLTAMISEISNDLYISNNE